MKTKLLLLLAFICQISFSQVSNANLLAHYNFENNGQNQISSNFHFLSGNGFVTHSSFGKVGRSALFNTDGIFYNNTLKTYFDNATSQSFTISFWSYQSTANSSTTIYFDMFNSAFVRGNTQIGIATSSTTTVSNGTQNQPLNQWNHNVYIFDQAEQRIKLYLNGNLVTSILTNSSNFHKNIVQFCVGGGINAGNFDTTTNYNAYMDEMYIFNRAITPSEITALYNLATPSPCPPGDVTLTTQAEVDAFVAQYPNCTEINGDLTITTSGNTINNLSSLGSLTTILGDFNLLHASTSANLSALQNITTVGGILYIGGGWRIDVTNLNFLSGLTSVGSIHINSGTNSSNTTLTNIEGLSNISGSLTGGIVINSCTNLSSLNGLQNITSLGSNLSLVGNPALVNLTGLNGLTSLNNNSSGTLGNIFMNNNSSLTSLDGLQNLTNLTKDNLANTKTGFAIYNCNSLTDISALGNINNAVVESIAISNNTSLNNCAIATVCNKLAVDTNWVTISGNATGCESIAVVQAACNPDPCPQGDVTLTTQAEVDTFIAQYPNCTEIDGNLIISGITTNNLTGLNNITTVNGFLSISGTNITNGNIFNNLTSVSGMINIQNNPVLSDLSGFNALVSTPNTIQINNNQSLTQVSGFNALTTVGLNLSVLGAVVNPLPLNSISGFSNVQSVGYLLIRNTALANLSQLSSLQAINFGLSIDNNPLLTSITALSNCTNAMNGNGTYPFRIFENHSLESLNGINFSSVTNTFDVQIYGLHLVETINELNCLQGNFPAVQVRFMPVLQNLNGLSNITGIGTLILNNNPLITTLPSWNLTQLENISISTMASLTSIATLSGVNSMGNSAGLNAITLNGNPQLSNLTGLQNITNLNNKGVFFNSNTNLTDITALNSLTINTLGGFAFSDNTNLVTCSVDWVCNRLALNTNNISISNNATGCESIAVVQAACDTLSSTDFELESNLKIYPNPFNSQITFDFGNSYENVTVLIYDITGKQLYKNSFSGNQLVVNNLGNLPSGIYVATLTTENGTSITKKIVK